MRWNRSPIRRTVTETSALATNPPSEPDPRASSPRAASVSLRRVAALCLAVLALSMLTACGDKPVATVSTEAEAIEMIDVLREGGFETDKREVGEGETKKWGVFINEGYFGEGDLGLAIQVLHDHGLPRPEEPPVEGGSSFVPSETVQRQQEQRRIRADIERQLRALPGVTSAIVTIVLPPADQAYRIHPQPATASALVIYKDEKPLFNEQQVQYMVARSVPDLQTENVSVTLSQQTPRPVPHRELSARRRTNILLAASIGLVTVLGFLLIVLLLQTRRQRSELAELREGQETMPEDEEDEAQSPTPGLSATGGREEKEVAGMTRQARGASSLPPAASPEP